MSLDADKSELASLFLKTFWSETIMDDFQYWSTTDEGGYRFEINSTGASVLLDELV